MKAVFLDRDHPGTLLQPRERLRPHLEGGKGDASKAPDRSVRRPGQLRTQAILGCGDSLSLEQSGSRGAQAALGKRRHVELNDDADRPFPRGAGGDFRRNRFRACASTAPNGEQGDQGCEGSERGESPCLSPL